MYDVEEGEGDAVEGEVEQVALLHILELLKGVEQVDLVGQHHHHPAHQQE